MTGGIGGGGQVAPVVDVATPEEKQTLAEANKQVAERGRELSARWRKPCFPRSATQPASASTQAAGLSGDVAAALKQPPGKRSIHALQETAEYYKTKNPEYAAAVTRLDAGETVHEQAVDAVPKVMVDGGNADSRAMRSC